MKDIINDGILALLRSQDQQHWYEQRTGPGPFDIDGRFTGCHSERLVDPVLRLQAATSALGYNYDGDPYDELEQAEIIMAARCLDCAGEAHWRTDIDDMDLGAFLGMLRFLGVACSTSVGPVGSKPRLVIEAEITDEDRTVEEGGRALILEVNEGDGEDDGVFVRLQSWNTFKAHSELVPFVGRRVRVTVEAL